MRQRAFFLGDKFLGAGPAEDYFCHGELRPPWSIAYFCPVCGTVWARVITTDQPFHVYTLSCEAHPSAWEHEIHGSLWIDWDKDFTNSFPPELLRREAILHLDHARRFT